MAFSAVTMLCRSAVLISVGAWHMNFDEEQSTVHWGIINCHYDQTLRAGSSGKPTNIVTVISQHATERHTSDIQWYIYCDNILWFFFFCVCVFVPWWVSTFIPLKSFVTTEKLCDIVTTLNVWTAVQEWGCSICECGSSVPEQEPVLTIPTWVLRSTDCFTVLGPKSCFHMRSIFLIMKDSLNTKQKRNSFVITALTDYLTR